MSGIERGRRGPKIRDRSTISTPPPKKRPTHMNMYIYTPQNKKKTASPSTPLTRVP